MRDASRVSCDWNRYVVVTSCIGWCSQYLELQQLSAKRLRNRVDKQKQSLKSFVPIESRNVVSVISKEYRLKGAAKPAQDSYMDPNYVPAVPPKDLMQEYGCGGNHDSSSTPGNLYDHEEGRLLLAYMLEHGTYLHNKMQYTRDAIKVFEEMLSYDREDNLVSCV